MAMQPRTCVRSCRGQRPGSSTYERWHGSAGSPYFGAMLRVLLSALALTSSLLLIAPSGLAQQTGPAGTATTTAAPGVDGGAKPSEAKSPSSEPSPATSEAAASAPSAAPPAPADSAVGAPAEGPATPCVQPTQAPAGAPAVSHAAARDLRDAVRFVDNDGRHVALFERKGDQWLRLCTSPCYFTAPDGPRDYAAPTKVGPATAGYRVAGKGIWLVNGDGLQADLQDRRAIRRAGAGLMLAGLVTLGFSAMAVDADDKGAALAAMLTTSGVLTLSGVIMLLMKDRVRLARCRGCNAGAPRAAGLGAAK
jgi:hypothetical protein